LQLTTALAVPKPASLPKPGKRRAGEITCDETLFERLRRLRKTLADKRSVPPYIIFSDVALRQMARYYPVNRSQFSRINGVGERKLEEFGADFMAEIAAYLVANPRQRFADD
jgi:ATP-dependent DNA helicase RecQ